MLFKRLGSAALAAAAATARIPPVFAQDSDDPNPKRSIFANADDAIKFAFGVPHDNQDQFFFTIRVHRSHAWGAIGLGSESMPGALYLMVYDNADQTNVTFSPRISYGHYEPGYWKDMEYELFETTGIYDEHMIVKGRCLKNCLTWPARGTQGGKIDINSEKEKGIYALGPLQGFASDELDESLKFHVQYGSFYMNMTRAHGATGAATLDSKTVSDGAILGKREVKKADVMSAMHAVFMVLAFVLLMPLGVVMLRLGGWVRWHALNQSIAMVLVLVGFGVGISTSLRYQRSRGFDSYHQVLGFLVIAFILVQFSLGFLHHRQYRQTQQPTKFGKIHLWFGRLILFLGIMNGFFGFTFAQNRRYGIVLAALVLAMCFAILITIVGRRFLTKRRMRHEARLRGGQGSPYNRPPVRSQGEPVPWQGSMDGPGQNYPAEPPPQYEPPQQNIGLRNVVSPWRSDRRSRHPAWGDPQAPRELI